MLFQLGTNFVLPSAQESYVFAFNTELAFSIGTDDEACVGLGVSVCKKVGKIAAAFGFGLDISTTLTWSHESSNSVSLGFTYSYTTTDNPYIPSKLGDMFLTPSLNVKFSKSALISFDPDTCAGSSKEIVTWSLDSPSNMPVCLFSQVSSSVLDLLCSSFTGFFVAQL